MVYFGDFGGQKLFRRGKGTQRKTTSPSLLTFFSNKYLVADIFCYEKEISDYKESLYNNKEHKNFCGHDTDGNPVVISVHSDTDHMTTQIILRDVNETRIEKFKNHEQFIDISDVDSVINLAKIVSPDLELEDMEEIECNDIQVRMKVLNKNKF